MPDLVKVKHGSKSRTEILDAALEYASSGWPVFPCDPHTKRPLTPNGFYAATTDIDQIVAWWTQHPAAMIGLPTGAASGVWVLDVDKKTDADGEEQLKRIIEKYGALPVTRIASTPSGGLHCYFQHVDGVRNRGSFQPGIDVRGEGGYVILPRSVRHDGCRYEWKSKALDIAIAPDWLLTMVTRPKAVEQPRSSSSKNNPSYSDAAIANELQKLMAKTASRNNQLNDSAMAIGQFVGANAISRSEAEDRLYGAAVANGYVAKDGEHAAKATIKSGLDAGQRQPRDIPESEWDGLPKPDHEWIVSWLAKLRAKFSNDNQRFQVTWYDDVNETVYKNEILQGVLGAGEFSLTVAKPGTAKSVLAADIGCHIAAGFDWHGRRVKQGLVVFFAAERKPLTERRIAAWKKKHGASGIPFVVVGGKLDLTSGLLDAKALAKTINELEEYCGQSCVLIILDTVTRTFGPGDQHQSKDMSKYIQAVDELNRSTGAHIMAIHHSTWAEDRGKGAIDLDGAIDASFGVKVNGTGVDKEFTFSCTGANDGEEGPITTFKLESVMLSVDDDGEETTAPVVIETSAKGRAPNLTEMALESLERAIKEQGRTVPDGSPGFPLGTVCVSPDVWRNQYYSDCRDREPQVTPEALSKRYTRAVNSLVKNNRVGRVGECNWIVQPDVTLH